MKFLQKYTVCMPKILKHLKYSYSTTVKLKPPWSVLFFGTDKFSLASLKALNLEYCRNKELINRLEIVTNPKNDLIKSFALENKLLVHNWPLVKIPSDFHIGLVVSFGHLIPKDVIDAFPMGMLNVHASLLPRWRGAAPIIYALANGDQTTGVTIMKIRPERFDIGDVLKQQEIPIPSDMKMPALYHELSILGAQTLVDTLNDLEHSIENRKAQNSNGVTLAPKVKPSMGNINFEKQSAKELYNLSRALSSLFPLNTKWDGKLVKIHNVCKYELEPGGQIEPGSASYDKATKSIKIRCVDGFIYVDKIWVMHKKIMNGTEFNNGYINKMPLDYRIFR